MRARLALLIAFWCAVSVLASSSAGATPPPAGAATTGPPILAPEQAPWSAYVVLGNESSCSGSVIDATHVLTAAHCTFGDSGSLPASAYQVYAGLTRNDERADPSRLQQRGVSAAARHPFYSNAHSSDDVAVLTLNAPLTFTPAVQPIAPAPVSTRVPTSSPLRVVGWGSTRAGEPDVFQRGVTIRRVERASCATGYPGILCAGSSRDAVCPGDSGAGLVMDSAAGPVLVGADSFGASGNRCVVGTADGYADLTSPEIGLWLRGVAKPPRGPRTRRPARVVAHAGHRVSCRAPRWTGKPRLDAAYFLSGSPKPVHFGKSYRVPVRSLRRRVTCVSIARNRYGAARAASANSIRFR